MVSSVASLTQSRYPSLCDMKMCNIARLGDHREMNEMLNAVLPFLAAAKPAGGAAAGEVIGATTAALVATAVVLTLGIAHRSGRTRILKVAAEHSAKISGLPSWAALPVGFASVSLLIALFGMYWDISLHID